jgi:hypothetical protein
MGGFNAMAGGTPTTGAVDVRVDTQMPEDERVRPYFFPSSTTFGRLKGKDVNHGTIV